MIEQFINKLVAQPWSIDRVRGRTLIASLVQRLRTLAERPDEDLWGDPLPTMKIVGDVAVVPICGTLMLGLPDWIKKWGVGLTDINDIAEELTRAKNDPQVAFTVLDFDSPGGWSLAGQKLFDLVAAAQTGANGKPVFAWCGDGAEVCSAAYHGASPAQMFLTAPYAMAVGCIGTYNVIVDDREFWKTMGITIEVLRSGEMKGMGIDGFSEAQVAWLQEGVDQCGALFRKNVSKYRTELDAAEMEGQWYDGRQAAGLGFTHGTAVDVSAAIAKFRRQL